MKILAIETSTLLGGIAVADDSSGLIAEIRLNVKSTHSERLMTAVDHVLKQSGLDISDMDAFAVAIGPGSFTGLRIGMSTVKGFSYATGKPIVSVPTLEAFAWNFPYSGYPVCPMLDARKNEVYAGIYKWEGNECKKIMPETAINPADLLKEIKGMAVFAGDGAKIYKKLIMETLKDNAIFAPPSKMSPSASSVAEIAVEKIRQGIITDPVTLTPFYLRKSEAEIKENAKFKNQNSKL